MGDDDAYKNGLRDADITNLKDRVDAIEAKIWWLVAGIIGAIISNFPTIIKALK